MSTGYIYIVIQSCLKDMVKMADITYEMYINMENVID